MVQVGAVGKVSMVASLDQPPDTMSPEVLSEEQVQLFSRIWPVRRSSSVTPQDFWPEFDPFVEGALPMSDFLSQHLPMLGL